MPDLRIVSLALLALLGLAACDGGGSGTRSNPNPGTDVGDSYSGPAAKTADVRSFQTNFWEFLRKENRCGQCHDSGQSPTFVDGDDVNAAYSQAIAYANLQSPSESAFVGKVGGGHNCWLESTAACADNVEQMIVNWATDSNITSSRQIQLTAPDLRDPGAAKSFPPSAFTEDGSGNSFANTVHELLIGVNPPIANDNCQNCHEEIATPLPQAPFFASADAESAYQAARSKMDIDTPANSRFAERLAEGHNCWSECDSDETAMVDAITLFAEGILPTPVDPDFVTSKALNLTEGIVAAGGSRHESNMFAIWEFKTGTGGTAFDTSGIDPAIDLSLIGSVTWLGGYGLEFSGGRAIANTVASDKINSFVQATGEFAIEAWVIPANVTQEDANIVSYSGSDAQRNFTLGQNMYNYDFYNRHDDSIDTPDANGEPFLSTGDDGEELAQASLQHVVANYSPIDGRSIYVNGELVEVDDPVTDPTTVNNVWDDSFALLLGNETSGNRPWSGQLRMVALHNRMLTEEQVVKNFEVGVGEKYFLLFSISHRIGIPDSYILFEVSQFDNYSYLFNRPTYINLDPDWVPVSFDIAGMRIGINGKQAVAGQAFASIDVTVNASDYDPLLGQQLSSIGSIIALEKGADSDEFFLTFERLGSETNAFVDIVPTVPADPADPAEPAIESDIGMRTFEEINTTIAEITGVPVTNPAIRAVYDSYVQQLPTVETIDAFLPSHQMAIAQLALTSCSELVDNNGSITRGNYFPGFVFSDVESVAFDSATKRNRVIEPLLTAAMNVNIATPADNLQTQPAQADVSDLLGATGNLQLEPGYDNYDSLIEEMINGVCNQPFCDANSASRTRQIVKAVCAVTTGAAVMLVQ